MLDKVGLPTGNSLYFSKGLNGKFIIICVLRLVHNRLICSHEIHTLPARLLRTFHRRRSVNTSTNGE